MEGTESPPLTNSGKLVQLQFGTKEPGRPKLKEGGHGEKTKKVK